jgi:hypothetical protein
MNAPPAPAPPPTRGLLLLSAVSAAGLLAAAAGMFWLAAGVAALETTLAVERAAQARRDEAFDQVLAEVTRLRIEQSTGLQGPQAMLERLRVYAPLAADSRTAEPDYRNAKKEMAAVQRAFRSLGKDAWAPIQARLAELDPAAHAEEIKALLEAGVAADRDAGLRQLRDVLLGHHLPSPKLRWFAAHALIQHDRPLAQATLRQVLLTESARGFNPAHAAAFPGAIVPDQAALSASGFFNFVVQYVRSGDPRAEDTLLQVVGRVDHDLRTVQECVKALGDLRSTKAVPVIERLYTDPPLQQHDPIFLSHCADALVAIQGAGAKQFLEQALAKTPHDLVGKRIQALLNDIANGNVPAPRARTEEQAKDERR